MLQQKPRLPTPTSPLSPPSPSSTPSPASSSSTLAIPATVCLADISPPPLALQLADSVDNADDDYTTSGEDVYAESRRPTKRAKLSASHTPRASSSRVLIEDGDEQGDEAEYRPPVHSKKATRRTARPHNGANSGTKANRRSTCPKCKKTFGRHSDLTRHQNTVHRVHTVAPTDRRDLTCDGLGEGGCGKAFSRADALTRHMRTCKKVPQHIRDRLQQSKRYVFNFLPSTGVDLGFILQTPSIRLITHHIPVTPALSYLYFYLSPSV